jgi:hypothetical protein
VALSRPAREEAFSHAPAARAQSSVEKRGVGRGVPLALGVTLGVPEALSEAVDVVEALREGVEVKEGVGDVLGGSAPPNTASRGSPKCVTRMPGIPVFSSAKPTKKAPAKAPKRNVKRGRHTGARATSAVASWPEATSAPDPIGTASR